MGKADRLEEIKSNIAQMKKWWKEGKKLNLESSKKEETAKLNDL